ncbi:phosphatase PAP2 family protein [Paenibacillus sp. N1-5-1-14]|uniref:phosphatase PAP2 family protein n=1 Tax=Paenibacillus radicibacter TaxID=2972488 RepID=UPI0021599D5D|nr:phosphatase PAP2 family protein [Paenibacillus radicibacter]MCR8645619.1 phosphatase PAP2 family protein [Paenibacillus radicibacter]
MTKHFIIMPLLWLITAAVLIGVTQVDGWDLLSILLLIVALYGTKKDMKDIPWVKFIPAGLATLIIFFLIYKYANPLWNQVIGWQTKNIKYMFKWNEWFNSIPYNDGAWMRLWQPAWLTHYMSWVYRNGFTLSYWICIIRAFFTKDVKKMGVYALGGYLLQTPFILIFYNTVFLQEVWFVQGTPDILVRNFKSAAEVYTTVLNCFPSMHTSIAFAALLLSMKEKSKWYRWIIGIYCISIIISTLYLKIHWVLDVVAGMAFAYGCVSLAEWFIHTRMFNKFEVKFEGIGERLMKK